MIFISILSFILGNNSFYIKSKSVPLIVGGSQMSSRMSDGIYYTGIFNYTISDEKHSTKVRIGIGYKKDMKDKYIINLNLTSWHNVTCPKFYLTNFHVKINLILLIKIKIGKYYKFNNGRI